mmetsp:Transcript_39750/g.105010  ORF Transcript_39750/g.105010 Transcript_39750/m.105010 type:complete len:350 (-) Transcript_39750:164-1213(-)
MPDDERTSTTAVFSLDGVALLTARRSRSSRTLMCLICSVVATLIYATIVTAQIYSPATRAWAKRESALDRVLRTRVLRAICPLDYAPFGVRGDLDCPDQAHGADIDAIKTLADSLDATVELLPSTWSTLMTDFEQYDADIGIGGITPTLDRLRHAGFSSPYFLGGKVLVARCNSPPWLSFVAAQGHLRVINTPTTYVLVNPGGTNENVVRELLPRATVRLVSANGEQFRDLASSSASESLVTLTDSVEALLQARRHAPKLCSTSDYLLTRDAKAFLLPRDDMPWAAYVNAWLEEAWLASGMRDVTGAGDGIFGAASSQANASLDRWISLLARNASYCNASSSIAVRRLD